jgi:hypothetical protein
LAKFGKTKIESWATSQFTKVIILSSWKMTWSEYTSQIRAIINELGRRRILIGEVPLKSRLVKNKGNIFTKVPHITFQYNAILEFSEEISIW